ncbi:MULTISPECIES: GTP cyclohydrolase FolE2 [Pontibacillus]|uniref:GTP cyclohydrolase FolE2 n=1 Tax=Pontibacillus chungwhensis TaxID=265426 RepID=A0ABY8V4D4_9BACI|nr:MULTISPECIES: GTP cyclohydrolase FolE2 [Pontibacillus]MCD5322808.1 GTP cyclohydrolase FolE2 [Pontibacillus sp. HN14]WIG00078.1 GTP cyclohydrolase FolE2 [Pontibacillus chungwhensis]
MNQTNINTKKQLPSKEDRHKLFGSVDPGPRTKPVEKDEMADLQNSRKDFLFDLDAVGISNVKHPIRIYSSKKPEMQTTIGTFRFASKIGKGSKGTNMSRFTEQLDRYHNDGFAVDITTLKKFTKELAQRLKQDDAEVEVSYPWFFERKGPFSDLAGMNHADATMKVSYHNRTGYDVEVALTGKITTLCPCSKEISEYSAHNQRGNVTMSVRLTDDFDENDLDWKEALLEAAESNASARIHPVLKRPDEKAVTEQAYENPRFVEDIVRLVAADLYELSFVERFYVACRNEESIHLHDAIAEVTYDKTVE